MSKITFIDDNGTFVIRNPENYSGLYFPLAGEQGIKASITPNLGGDSKLDQNHFLLEPVSIENLHNNKNTRNFWCMIDGNGAWSVTGSSARQEYEKFTGQQDESELKAGFMWQELTRTSKEFGLQAVTSSFVSIDGSAEIMLVEIKNISDRPLTFTPIAAVPIYGRSADNIRDHRHVTSLLHRTQVTESGVYVKPTLSFDERGHQKNDTAYFVSGFDENGQYPADFYPTVESFIGEGGSFLNPEAVRIRKKGYRPGDTIDGKESVGAFAFEERALKPGETAGYIVVLGAVKEPDCRKAADKNAVIPETGKRAADIPETEQRATNIPETEQRAADIPETEQRAADIPETEQRATNIPDAGHRIGDIPEAGQRIADSRAAACMEAARRTGDRYRTVDAVKTALDEVKKYWAEKVNVAFHTGNADTDRFLKWICFQPTLRRIYGCSFLPYHDYGKGGRGWRDLWQDCLALLIMDPMGVREMIVDNYCGVRIDGTNATIIGSRQGEFIADRNNITRVWMDHAFWPFLTTKLYIDQTGDTEILLEKIPYFKDLQAVRGTVHDTLWDTSDGNLQKTEQNSVYYGSIIEHILLQNLCAFYEVGEHNEIRLRGADWNDAIDMAAERGESVAFTCAYAGNLRDIAEMLRTLKRKTGITQIAAAKEMQVLFSSGKELYEDTEAKNRLLTDYAEACRHTLSGETVLLAVDEICADLEEKASWMMAHIRANEWISDAEGGGWYNSYYDNNGRQVERGRSNSDNHILQIERNTDSIEIHAEQDADSTEIHAEQDEGCVYSKTAGQIDQNQIRMMLTGQVFAIMSGTATEEQIRAITKSADTYLYDPKAGGYRLNTDFKEEKFDMGRMFGFAYGEKENGAVFSHMAVMYGNALYKQGFAGEGYKVLRSLLDTAEDFETSRMYPGIPEYFDKEGRGLYAYLTGAASWFMLTMIREVFGVRGDCGDLVIRPALLPEQFDADGNAGIRLNFAQRSLEIRLHYYKESAEGHTGEQGNESAEREKATERDKSEHLSMECAMLDERELMIKDKQEVRIARDVLEQLDPTKEHVIRVKLR